MDTEDALEETPGGGLVLQSDLLLGQDLEFEDSSDRIMGFEKDSEGLSAVSCGRFPQDPAGLLRKADSLVGAGRELLSPRPPAQGLPSTGGSGSPARPLCRALGGW